MATSGEAAFAALKEREGTEEGVGEWFEITQERVDAFADATLDHQFIHVDPERAAQTPFGGPIAHGFLTLSLLVHLDGTIPKDRSNLAGVVMGVNYGLDKVRFLSPVPVGGRIRARSEVTSVTLKDPNTIDQKRTMTIELEGSEKPACVAEWITRIIFA